VCAPVCAQLLGDCARWEDEVKQIQSKLVHQREQSERDMHQLRHQAEQLTKQVSSLSAKLQDLQNQLQDKEQVLHEMNEEHAVACDQFEADLERWRDSQALVTEKLRTVRTDVMHLQEDKAKLEVENERLTRALAESNTALVHTHRAWELDRRADRNRKHAFSMLLIIGLILWMLVHWLASSSRMLRHSLAFDDGWNDRGSVLS